MTIMSSFRLKTYFNGSFQLSVSILTNILVIFLQHLLKIRMTTSPVKHKQTKTTQQQIQSHVKKVDVSRFSVVSNEATKQLNSVAVNKHSQTVRHTAQNSEWTNVLRSRCQSRHLGYILKTNGAARTWQGPEYWVLRRGHKKKRRW